MPNLRPEQQEQVRKYQQSRGLGVDGSVGRETWGALHAEFLRGSAATVDLVYRSTARKVVPEAERRLRLAAEYAGLDSLTITSTYRRPEDQVRAMYQNIEGRGHAYNLRLYRSAGKAVVNAHKRAREAGGTDEEVRAAMLAELHRVGPGNVSRHLGVHGLVVVDVSSPERGADGRGVRSSAFEAALTRLQAEGLLSMWLGPPRDPAYHCEFPIDGVDPTKLVA